VPFLLLADPAEEAAAADLLRLGAADFLLRPHLGRLGPAICRALEENRLRCALEECRRENQARSFEFERMVRNCSLELFLREEAHREDIRLSKKIHGSLSPRQFPQMNAIATGAGRRYLRFASVYRPASALGGDFFQVNRISESVVHIFIGDVMGHGVKAGLVSTLLRALEQSFIGEVPGPPQLLQRMNRTLCAISEDADPVVFATACALRLDLSSNTLLFAGAGHPPPVRVPGDGSPPRLLEAGGARNPALGIFPDADYPAQVEKLREGDRVFLLTDGIYRVENSQGKPLSPSCLLREISRDSARSPQETLDALIRFLETFSGTPSFPDDVCLLGVELRECSSAA
jgi:serine phosphatase RsbU (regulator of sigma subunit)